RQTGRHLQARSGNGTAGRPVEAAAERQAMISLPSTPSVVSKEEGVARSLWPSWEEIVVSRKKLSRNAPCPCGRVRKDKHCGYNKGCGCQQDEAGSVFKSNPMNDEMTDLLEQQRQKFIDKYGREPGPNDPVFFDLPPVEQIEFQTVQAMKKAGIDPAIIYAYEKTGGRPITEQNRHLISDT